MRGQTWWEKVQQRLGVKVAIVGRKSVSNSTIASEWVGI
jgi:hypothetical protein